MKIKKTKTCPVEIFLSEGQVGINVFLALLTHGFIINIKDKFLVLVFFGQLG